MKHKNIFLSILLSIFLLGIILTVVSIACGASLFAYQSGKIFRQEGYQNDMTQLTPEEATAIQGIDFNAQTNQLQIVIGDSYSISGDGYYKSYVKDGIWHVETARYITSLSFLSHTINIPNFANSRWRFGNNDHKNIISIPAGVTYRSVNICAAAGELKADLIVADDISIKVGAGEIKLNELASKNLNVKAGAGEIKISKLNVTDSCHAKIGAGELTLGDKEFPAGTNRIANLTGKCSLGEMDIAGKLTGNTSLKVSTGQMNLLLDGHRNNYYFETNSNLADIKIASEPSQDGLDSHNGYDSHGEQQNEHFGTIDLKCSLGEIDVNFQKE